MERFFDELMKLPPEEFKQLGWLAGIGIYLCFAEADFDHFHIGLLNHFITKADERLDLRYCTNSEQKLTSSAALVWFDSVKSQNDEDLRTQLQKFAALNRPVIFITDDPNIYPSKKHVIKYTPDAKQLARLLLRRVHKVLELSFSRPY